MDEEVEQIIQKIMEEADVDRNEILKQLESKKEELSGFITPKGAATIIARNYGITPEKKEPEVRKLLIEDLSDGMSNVDIVGKVERTFEPREFERKDGSEGKVANLIIADKTGEIRTVLWDKMSSLVSEEEIQKGTSIRLKGAYIKKGRNESLELNIGRRGEIEIFPEDERTEDLPSLEESKNKISELDPEMEFADIIGRVTAITSPRKFKRSNGSEGKVSTLRIIDETGQCRVSIWGDKAEQVDKIERGDAIKLENASVREGWQNIPELHLNWRGRIILNPPRKEVENLPEFEKKLLKIEEIEPDMPALDVAGRVRRKFSPQEFERDDGSSGKVMNVVLADETGTIRASFWDDLVEKAQKLSVGDVVLLENAKSRTGLQDNPEIRVSRRTSIKINPEEIKIKDVQPSREKMSGLDGGIDSLETIGRVVGKSGLKEFTQSDGNEGQVASLTIGDETGRVSMSLWGPKAKLIDRIEIGDILKITGAYTTPNNFGRPEIRAGEQAEIEINPSLKEEIPPVGEIPEGSTATERVNIEEVEENMQVGIRGTIVQIFERNPIFSVCPRCGRNLKGESEEILCENCEQVVKKEKRAVINMVIDDGTGNLRAVAFGELAQKLFGASPEEISERISQEDDLTDFYDELELKGREVKLRGTIKRDDYFDQLELRIRDLSFPDPIEESERILEKIEIRDGK